MKAEIDFPRSPTKSHEVLIAKARFYSFRSCSTFNQSFDDGHIVGLVGDLGCPWAGGGRPMGEGKTEPFAGSTHNGVTSGKIIPRRSFCSVTCSMNKQLVVSICLRGMLCHSGRVISGVKFLPSPLLHLPPGLRSCSRSSTQPNLRICCYPGASWLGPASYALCYAFGGLASPTSTTSTDVCVDVCCVVHVRPVWSRTCASCHALTTCFAGLHFILQILDETPVTADFPLKSKCE